MPLRATLVGFADHNMRLRTLVLLSLLTVLPCAGQSGQTAANNVDAGLDKTLAVLDAHAASTLLPRAARLLASLRNQMRDPDSFVLEKISRTVIEPLSPERAKKKIGKREAKANAAYAATVGTEIFCFQFRSRNGYGGMDRAIAEARGGEPVVVFDSNVAELLHPHGCGGEDLTARLLEWTATQK